jgi:hypothetical protein
MGIPNMRHIPIEAAIKKPQVTELYLTLGQNSPTVRDTGTGIFPESDL